MNVLNTSFVDSIYYNSKQDPCTVYIIFGGSNARSSVSLYSSYEDPVDLASWLLDINLCPKEWEEITQNIEEAI